MVTLAPMTQTLPRVTPRLVIDGAAQAIEFYVEVLGAEVFERFDTPGPDGKIVHCALAIGETVVSVTEADEGFCNSAPATLGGTPVLLTLEVEDALAVGARLEQAGAEVIIPIEDRFYGKREGRLRDPFGHLWIVSQTLEALGPEEIMRRLAAT